MEASLWEDIRTSILEIEQKFSAHLKQTFVYLDEFQKQLLETPNNEIEALKLKIQKLERKNKDLKIKNMKFKDKSHVIVMNVKKLFDNYKPVIKEDHSKFDTLISECTTKFNTMNRVEEDVAAEFDPEFDSLMANMLSYVS